MVDQLHDCQVLWTGLQWCVLLHYDSDVDLIGGEGGGWLERSCCP